MSPPDFLGISLSTIVFVLIDMKCQQFIVQTKDVRNVYLGSVLAARLILEVTGYNHAPPPASGQQRKI